MKKNSNYGLWIAYIDTMTAFGAIFLILFLFLLVRARTIDEKSEQLLKSWKSVKEQLLKLNAEPVIDKVHGGIRLTVAENILFNINSAQINTDGQKFINSLSKILINFIKLNVRYKDAFRIIVGGHTDSTGTDQINFPLSYQRAYNVSDIIKQKFNEMGLDTKNIMAIGYGSKYLIDSLKMKPFDPRHRRVTIVVQLLSTEFIKE